MSFESSLTWVQPGFLCFGEKPGRWRSIEDDIAFLQTHRVAAIISLLEVEPALDLYHTKGFFARNIPVHDFQAPSQSQIVECMEILHQLNARGVPTYIHCYAGLGRSGTMAGAWLIRSGTAPVEAITKIRRARPGAIESDLQYNALLEFAASL
jgi:atypical dual specificity phosphatase